MHPILRNVLAVISGLVVGSAVNMTLVMIGPMLIPPPSDADITTMEGLAASIHLFEPKHFLFPFLAHALGTLVGAALTSLISLNQKRNMALVIGGFFLVGGVMNVSMLPSPMWFNALDLAVAYIPMALLGWCITGRNKG